MTINPLSHLSRLGQRAIGAPKRLGHKIIGQGKRAGVKFASGIAHKAINALLSKVEGAGAPKFITNAVGSALTSQADKAIKNAAGTAGNVRKQIERMRDEGSATAGIGNRGQSTPGPGWNRPSAGNPMSRDINYHGLFPR